MRLAKYVRYAIVLVIVALGIAWVIRVKGLEQLGNALSFVGTLLTLVPPLMQIHGNWKYDKALRIPTSPDLKELDIALEDERRLDFMAFKGQDLFMMLLGIILVSGGFLTSIILSEDRPREVLETPEMNTPAGMLDSNCRMMCGRSR